MSQLLVFLLVVYVVGALFWGGAAMASWDINTIGNSDDIVRDRKAAARRMMLTPVWPLALVQWIRATIKRMAADAQEEQS